MKVNKWQCYVTIQTAHQRPHQRRKDTEARNVIKTAWEANRSAANSNDPKRQRLRGIKNEAIKERGG